MARSRCPHLAEVRRALNDCAGDVDAAAEFLLALNNWGQDVTGERALDNSWGQPTKISATDR